MLLRPGVCGGYSGYKQLCQAKPTAVLAVFLCRKCLQMYFVGAHVPPRQWGSPAHIAKAWWQCCIKNHHSVPHQFVFVPLHPVAHSLGYTTVSRPVCSVQHKAGPASSLPLHKSDHHACL